MRILRGSHTTLQTSINHALAFNCDQGASDRVLAMHPDESRRRAHIHLASCHIQDRLMQILGKKWALLHLHPEPFYKKKTGAGLLLNEAIHDTMIAASVWVLLTKEEVNRLATGTIIGHLAATPNSMFMLLQMAFPSKKTLDIKRPLKLTHLQFTPFPRQQKRSKPATTAHWLWIR